LAAACRHLGNCTDSASAACGTPRFCLAFASQNPAGALIWNRAKWTFTKLPLVGGHPPELTALYCGSPSNCVATGTYQLSPRNPAHPIVEHWNGKAWAITRPAQP